MIDVALTAAGVRPAAGSPWSSTCSGPRRRSPRRWPEATSASSARPAASRRSGWRRPGGSSPGRRRCVPPPGFDLGNSPAGVETASGRELVLATSNGTPAIVAAAAAAELTLLGCLANLDALLGVLGPRAATARPTSCSSARGRTAGWRSRTSTWPAGSSPGSGPAHGRGRDVRAWSERPAPRPADLFRESTNGRLLVEVGLESDIAWCARESTLDIVPRVGFGHGRAGGHRRRGRPAPGLTINLPSIIAQSLEYSFWIRWHNGSGDKDQRKES